MPANRRTRIALSVSSVAVACCLLYAAAGYLLAPRMIERKLETLARERLAHTLTVERTRVNPFALSVEFTGVRLAPKSGPAPIATRRLYINLALVRSLVGRGLVLDEVQCDQLQGVVEVQADGRFNIAELARRWRETSPPAQPRTETAPLRLTIGHLVLSNGMLTYRELTDAEAVTQMLPIQIELQNVSTLPDREGRYSLAARLIDGGNLTWRGDLSLQPLQSEGEIEVQSLQLATLWRFVREDVRLGEPGGWLSLSTHYRFSYAGEHAALDLSRLRVHGAGLKVRREGFQVPLLTLSSVDVRDGRFNLGKRSLELPQVALSTGSLSLGRDVNGAWNWSEFARKPGPPRTEAARPRASPWRVDVAAAKIENIELNYQDWQHPAPLSARAALNGSMAVSADVGGNVTDLQITSADLTLEKLRLPANDAPMVEMGALRVQGGYLQLGRHEMGAKRLEATHGTIRVERSANGTVPLLQMLKAQEKNRAASSLPADSSPAWRFGVDTASLQRIDVAWTDLAGAKPTILRLNGVAAEMTGFGARDGPLEFKASAALGGGGSLAAKGAAAADLSEADARMTATDVALVPFAPLVARYATVDLVSGTLSAKANVAYRRDGKPRLSVRMPFELADFRLNEAGTDNRLVSWQRLSSAKARMTLGPDRFFAPEIIVEAPAIKVDVSEQRRLNLLQVVRPRDTAASASPASAAESPMSIQIGEVRLRDGTVDYSDRSLVLPFATRVTNFRGSAASLSTDRDQRARLDFEGEIGEFGSARIQGELKAFAPETMLDVRAAFENVEMPQLSPYTATFLGRKIASGKLWLDLEYRIDDSVLAGDNKVTIRELSLGEPVEAPGVRRLPLDLAVALLTDSQGVIRVAVPVKGNMDDPKFDIAAVIRDAVGNLIGKIVSAPFRALAGLVGGKAGEQAAGRIDFEPGSSELKPSEREKLQTVAKVLGERPQLKLVVPAPFAPGADREAVQRDKAMREVALAMGQTLEPEEKPGPVVFENLATQRALERAFSKKTEPAAMRDLVAQYTQKAGQEPKRAGMIFRTPGDPDFYKAMFEQLAQSEDVGDDALRDLATRRAQAVVQSLRSAGIEPARLQPGPAKANGGDEHKNVSAELSLQPVERPSAASADPAVAAR